MLLSSSWWWCTIHFCVLNDYLMCTRSQRRRRRRRREETLEAFFDCERKIEMGGGSLSVGSRKWVVDLSPKTDRNALLHRIGSSRVAQKRQTQIPLSLHRCTFWSSPWEVCSLCWRETGCALHPCRRADSCSSFKSRSRAVPFPKEKKKDGTIRSAVFSLSLFSLFYIFYHALLQFRQHEKIIPSSVVLFYRPGGLTRCHGRLHK